MSRSHWWAAATVAAGGVLGASARYAVVQPGRVWDVLVVNLVGCFAIGVLAGLTRPGPLRLFLGTGFLGGFTTFSAYAVDVLRLAGPVRILYLVGTVVGALAAVTAGRAVTGFRR